MAGAGAYGGLNQPAEDDTGTRPAQGAGRLPSKATLLRQRYGAEDVDRRQATCGRDQPVQRSKQLTVVDDDAAGPMGSQGPSIAPQSPPY